MKIGLRMVRVTGDLPEVHVGFGASSSKIRLRNLSCLELITFFTQLDRLLNFLIILLGSVALLSWLPLYEYQRNSLQNFLKTLSGLVFLLFLLPPCEGAIHCGITAF